MCVLNNWSDILQTLIITVISGNEHSTYDSFNVSSDFLV